MPNFDPMPTPKRRETVDQYYKRIQRNKERKRVIGLCILVVSLALFAAGGGWFVYERLSQCL